ncbi:MAG: DUF4338 domain-containing protein [Actinobacteria bacterium]|nr:DUF4338 domain-containing protein [Actinomycetota bacterium]
MTELLRYRKRIITSNDVRYIRQLIADNPHISRRALSQKVCRDWNWIQDNGHLKDMVCRSMMLLLEREGHIALPPRKRIPHNPLAARKPPKKIAIDQTPIRESLADMVPIKLRQVRRSEWEAIYNSLIEQYHYLSYTQPVGEHLKYIFFSGKRPVACLSFSNAPYWIDCRDCFIGWSPLAREKNRHLLAYNTRFLILPWVRVPHLASHLLSLCAKQINSDWQRLYHHPILWLETFVDTERFKGTCYKAANWKFLGLTKGTGKDSKLKRRVSIKAMFGYPLARNFREILGRI